MIGKKNQVTKSYNEKRIHANLYAFYNRIFGDSAEKQRERNRRYYLENREQILAEKRKKPDCKMSVIQHCEQKCEECPHSDCILPIYRNRKEYMDLYYQKFHDQLLRQKAEYREKHRTRLTNQEKIRNYRKKGYCMWECLFISTDNSEEKKFEHQSGILTIIRINGFDYLSFITCDMENSFRKKIRESAEIMADIPFLEICFTDYGGKKFIFAGT